MQASESSAELWGLCDERSEILSTERVVHIRGSHSPRAGAELWLHHCKISAHSHLETHQTQLEPMKCRWNLPPFTPGHPMNILERPCQVVSGS
ncbi:unnamed protein product [Caretta caretta]